LSKSALTTLKTAVFAPIPIASDATITRVRPSVRLNVRSAYRMSCRKSVIARSMSWVGFTDSTYGEAREAQRVGDSWLQLQPDADLNGSNGLGTD
jgi:hypothetical protein